jgi:DNA-binding response OmpR family regulator
MRRKVLVAEDEPNIVASLEFLLANAGYEVCVARCGDEALRLAEALIPDVLLLDVMMPVHDGFEVCRRVRSAPALAGVKIVMLTARGLEEERRTGLALGADAYITKPFSTKELLATVGGLLPLPR